MPDEVQDIVADQPTPENTTAGAASLYAQEQPSLGEALTSQVADNPAFALSRATARGQFGDASLFDKSLHAALTLGNQPPKDAGPMLAPKDANAQFAPEGTTITDQPMSEGLARVIGRQKQDEMDREATWQRFSDAHAWPTTFAAGTVAFLADPLNAASMFIPGLGEEAILGGLGRAGIDAASSVAGRLAVRGAAGAASAVAAQAPLVGMRYALGTEEASDYDLRAAFKDLSFAAALGAAGHAGFGALRETGILRPDELMTQHVPPAPTPAVDVASVMDADASTTHAAMTTSMSQLVSGRPVDVTDVFPSDAAITDVAAIADHQQQIERAGYAPGIPQPEFDATTERLYPQTAAEEPEQTAPLAQSIAVSPHDEQIATLEQSLTANPYVTDDDRAQIAQVNVSVEQAAFQEHAYAQAAQCLGEAGL